METDRLQPIDGAALDLALRQLEQALGPAGVLRERADLERYGSDASGLDLGQALAVLRPVNTEECAAAVRICSGAGIAMVPQGGRTGLSGGSCSIAGAVVLSTERLLGECRVDRAAMLLTASAGIPLQKVQEAARAVGLDYPVDIGARGTATIGGTLATNAGGIRVLRHGMTRRHVVGLEAVLPDGRIFSRMNGLVKDNAGYDLAQLFIGSEGTLGLITRVVLQLRPQEPHTSLILIALQGHAAALHCLAAARQSFGDRLSAFEGMWPDYWEAICHRWALASSPLSDSYGFYVLMEFSAADADALSRLEEWLAHHMEAGLILDGVIARSLQEENRLWALREAVGEVDADLGPHISFDVSVAPHALGAFCDASDAALGASPSATGWIKVGHVGDGNVHLLVAHSGAPQDAEQIERCVYALVRQFAGSITAEHGIGRLKKRWRSTCRDEVDSALSRILKSALDPKGLMNPGAVL